MTKHLQRDIENLKRELLTIAVMVESALNKALLALVDRRKELAREVILEDNAINGKEVQIEEECLKVLALHQPVAGDLRFVIAVLKVNNDLERMGDLACNIAERAAYLLSCNQLTVTQDFPRMADNVRAMVRMSLDSLTNLDAELALKVLEMDDKIDAALKKMFDVLQTLMLNDPNTIIRAIHLLSASRNLERIADLTTNIAEDVIYIVNGELVRHRVFACK